MPVHLGARIALVLALAVPCLAEPDPIVIIVNPDSGVTRMTLPETANVFLGNQKRLSSGLMAFPVDSLQPAEIRSRFYRLLTHKDVAAIDSYWARLYFTGQAQPPFKAQSAGETLDLVASNRGAIGFLAKSRTDHRVRIVLELSAPGGP